MNFKKLFNEAVLFSKKNENKFKQVLNLESTKSGYILTYLDSKIKKQLKLNEEDLSNYKFIERSNNQFYKKYKSIDAEDVIQEKEVISEMTFTKSRSGEYYSVSNIVKVEEGYEITYLNGIKEEKVTLTEDEMVDDYHFLKKEGNKTYERVLDIIQEMDTGSVGVGGTGDQFSGDFYAPDDARNVVGTNANAPMIRRNKITDTLNKNTKKPKKKKKKKSGKKQKSKIVYNGINFDSEEEKEFYMWLEEAVKYKFVKDFDYNSKSYELSPKETMTVTKQLKTKTKEVEKHLFQPHIYSPDFWIRKGERWDLLEGSHKLVTTHDDEEFIIDTKGAFQQNDGGRSFSINQKWLYQKYGIYTNKVIPEKFFKAVWIPEKCRYTPKKKQLKKAYIGFPTLYEKFASVKEV